jgi:hypothetical protein
VVKFACTERSEQVGQMMCTSLQIIWLSLYQSIQEPLYIYMYTYRSPYIYTHIYTYSSPYTSIYICTYTDVDVLLCEASAASRRVYLRAGWNIYIDIYIYRDIYIYIYIYQGRILSPRRLGEERTRDLCKRFVAEGTS